ncbi:hypothetical protein [Mucilaginibacter sp. 10B2]|uniref:hypothetical protein n=1 Tax=Mucilaginibacter sp. 10B2 TaxID=3048574 RepID=UPI002B2358A4|nr:hypothetical protein [Mucilaginibacter sp. 10B2]MEB0277186.1 hypothetical protein [Mucilaginibacter sp. 10B2]
MDYSVFLLPQGEIMTTAIVESDKLKILKKTLFPSGKRYSISKTGVAVCLDKEKKLILYGQILKNGEFGFYKLINFPEMISPKSICILNHHIILGGENHSHFNENIVSNELVVTYNILNEKFTALEMPFKQSGKCIDDLLIDDDTIIAVDNIVYPKYLLEYNFVNPYKPYLELSHELPTNGTYESIVKGVLSKNFTILTSASRGQDGFGRYINIFNRGEYKVYIRLSQWYGWGENNEKTYHWSDTLIIDNYLCISALEDGIGLFLINNFETMSMDRSSEIQYFNPWNKKVIKLLKLPNENEKVVLIMSADNVNSYEVINTKEIIALYRTFKDRDKVDINNGRLPHIRYNNDTERDYFNAMTDGHLGNFDDFEGNIDDIDDWAGR